MIDGIRAANSWDRYNILTSLPKKPSLEKFHLLQLGAMTIALTGRSPALKAQR